MLSFILVLPSFRSPNLSVNEAAEKNGFNLFAGKAKCATCHFIPLFNGVVPPFFADTESEVGGVPASKNSTNAVLDPDEGRGNGVL